MADWTARGWIADDAFGEFEWPAEPSTDRAYGATVSVRGWSETESFNTTRDLIGYLGPVDPVTENDFPVPFDDSSGRPGLAAGGIRARMDLAAGWNEYRFTWTTPRLETDTLSLALGVAVIWETDRTDYLDDARLELVPVA